jgi:hypothetical protein
METDRARADQSLCTTCWDEGWVEVDQRVQEVGLVAQPVPCPDCTEAVCSACEAGRHSSCRETAFSHNHQQDVDCTCEHVQTRRRS